MNENIRIELQRLNELRFNRKHIDLKLLEFVQNDSNMQEGVKDGVEKLKVFLAKTYYQSKNERLAPLHQMDLYKIVESVFVGICCIKTGELFTSVSAKLAGRLGFDDKPAAITTMAEILAVLCETNVFDIYKLTKYDSMKVKHNIPLPQELKDFIRDSEYLPPMLCEPRKLVNNYSSGYLTHNDSLILGNGNHHNGDICLDVLNKKNSTPLKLCVEFLSKYEEEPNKEFETPEQREQWSNFKRQSYEFYTLMAQQGNKFYLTHKVDKRGRIYAQGYHISTQSTSFKKAIIELFEEEVVEGSL